MNTITTPQTEESITHIWERFNFKWIKAGILSGILAGTVAMIVACIAASQALGEWYQPFKLLGAGVYGGDALEFGKFGAAGVYGLLLHLALSSLYGATFAQLMNEKSKPSSFFFLAVVTSLIIWVFGGCLFMPTVNPILQSTLPVTFNVFLHLVFGASFGLIVPKVRDAFLKN